MPEEPFESRSRRRGVFRRSDPPMDCVRCNSSEAGRPPGSICPIRAHQKHLLATLRKRNRTLDVQAREIRALSRELDRRRHEFAQGEQLVEDLRRSREQLRGLSRRLVASQEAERSYVADQLYNHAGQVLSALQLQLAWFERGGEATAERLPLIRETLNDAIRELHDLAALLRPVGLDKSTLGRVLESYACEFGEAHGLSVRFDGDGTEALRVPAEVGTALFRAVQEGLANVVRHARATEIRLSLCTAGDQLCVTLADNGVGFELAGRTALPGLGLASMRERLETVGGQLQITSDGTGTTLRMLAPLAGEER